MPRGRDSQQRAIPIPLKILLRSTLPPVIGVCIALLPRFADAQGDFFRLSPGPLSKSHEKWDGATGCFKCHTIAGGKKGVECLDCHNHDALKKTIAAKRGLHATIKRPCLDCHTEHKGRTHQIVDWKHVGGRANFDHKRAGFVLTGMHEKAKCTACHKKRYTLGNPSYVGLSANCDACHKNPHKFSNESLRSQCKLCHVIGGQAPRQMRASSLPFKHQTATGVALVGKHATVRCVKCHKNGKMTSTVKRICANCHKNPHGKTFAEKPCTECHDPSRKFQQSTFDHDKTKFRLEGKHRKTACSNCHKDKNVKPARDCNACHRDPHGTRFRGKKCLECHASGGIARMVFDHTKVTHFKLTGRHRKLACRACHRGKRPKDFEKFKGHECIDCHAHKNAHKGQFKDKKCESCHRGAGQVSLVFDHNKDARFPVLGFHAPLYKAHKCKKCHKGGTYRTGKIKCVDCHKDSHKGELGADCKKCHTVEVKFAKTMFDHDRLSVFKLEGLHKKVPCKKCHPDRKRKTGQLKCADCHLKDSPHKDKLGTECDKCHTPEKKATKFNHETHTKFERTGVHRDMACSFCHRPPPAGGPPELGWTRDLKPDKLNLLFPVMGKTCSECHRDKHDGRFGTACQSCHRPTKFRNVSATTHDTGSFKLAGIHRTIPCKRCHTAMRQLAGLGETCQTCHWDDDSHRNGLGPFCGDCHGQTDWRPAHFNHVQTGFILRGMHRAAPCSGCHGVGTYQGTPIDCDQCHTRDAAAVFDPLHSAELTPCDRCHTEVGFVPARNSHPNFPLMGRHNFVSCRSCHFDGTYLGTPNMCESCHLTSYFDPATVPDHQAAGYPTTCEDCHTPIGWRPATTP